MSKAVEKPTGCQPPDSHVPPVVLYGAKAAAVCALCTGPRRSQLEFLAEALLSPELFIPGLCRFVVRRIIAAVRTISSSSRTKMSGARGTITAFARVLVSEPCRSLEAVAAIALFQRFAVCLSVPALAAGCPSPEFPAIHPIFVLRSRGGGPCKSQPERSAADQISQSSIRPSRSLPL